LHTKKGVPGHVQSLQNRSDYVKVLIRPVSANLTTQRWFLYRPGLLLRHLLLLNIITSKFFFGFTVFKTYGNTW